METGTYLLNQGPLRNSSGGHSLHFTAGVLKEIRILSEQFETRRPLFGGS